MPVKRILLPSGLLFLWLLIFCVCALFLVSTSMKKSSAICLFLYFYKGFAQNLWKRWFFLLFNDFLQNYSLQLWYIFSVSWMSLIHLFSWSRHFRYFQIKFNCQYLCGMDHCFSVVNFFAQKNQLEVDLFTLLLYSIRTVQKIDFGVLLLFSLKTLGLFH